ncbi:MAG: MgPME-cyclase complex family protein [Cyanobacteria bacterium P01_C01_bin.72]
MTTYYYVAASQKFLLEEEPFEEVIEERIRNYTEKNREIDFWFVKQPAFLAAPEMASVKSKIPQPCAAVITTKKQLATWLKLRLEYVLTGEFEAPTESIPEPLATMNNE